MKRIFMKMSELGSAQMQWDLEILLEGAAEDFTEVRDG